MSEPTRVLIDTDPGIDDAAALLFALGSPELDVVGVTTVAGNSPLEHTTANALRVLELAGAEGIPVAAGAERALVHEMRPRIDSVHGTDGLGGVITRAPSLTPDPRHAIELIADLAEEGPLTVVAIAPLTNLALALARYPRLVGRIDHLFVMGGARAEGNVTSAAEFNAWADPEAAARVLGSGVPLTLLPLDITHQAVLTGEEVCELGEAGRAGDALSRMIGFYGHRHVAGHGSDFAPLHDVLALQALVAPETIGFVGGTVTVDTGWSPSRGATLVSTAGSTHAARIGAELDRESFGQMLIDRVGTLP